jgi:SAM-dependent methyltransferase
MSDEALSAEKGKKVTVEISIPNQGKHRHEITGQVLSCVHSCPPEIGLGYRSRDAKPLDNAKNLAAKSFMEGDFDYMLMIDDDNPPIRNPLELALLDLDIIACPTLIWSAKLIEMGVGAWPWTVNCYDWEPRKDMWICHLPQTGLQEVDAVGMGCTFIHRRVFKEVWPFFQREYDQDGIARKGSDLLFCKRAKEAGFRIWAHFGFPADHVKSMSYLEVHNIMRQRDVRSIPRGNRNTGQYWDAQWEEREERVLSYYEYLVEQLKGKRVLDYGCGRGDLLAMLSEHNPECMGVDISGKAVEVCRSRGLRAEQVGWPVDGVGLTLGKWDAVVCTEVLEHVDNDEELLQALFGLSDHVVYAVPYDCLPPGMEPEHRRVYTDADMRRITPHLVDINYMFEPYAVVEAKRVELAVVETGNENLEPERAEADG